MEWLDWTLGTPEANLACDELLLDLCEETGREVLRIWEPRRECVVAGYSNRRLEGIRLDVCRRLEIPVLRRHSGGGTVLLGPGCLNFSLILGSGREGLSSITATNLVVLERLRRLMTRLTGEAVRIEGHTDLAIAGRKFSGNAQYRRRRAVLFHGTLMCGMDIGLIDETLDVPARAPDYRRGRSHREFLMNLEVQRDEIRRGLGEAWDVRSEFGVDDRAEILRSIGSFRPLVVA